MRGVRAGDLGRIKYCREATSDEPYPKGRASDVQGSFLGLSGCSTGDIGGVVKKEGTVSTRIEGVQWILKQCPYRDPLAISEIRT